MKISIFVAIKYKVGGEILMKNAVKMFALSKEVNEKIDSKLNSFEKKGVKASTKHSGEMNFNGCAKGYCQAWD